jgi:entericidin B
MVRKLILALLAGSIALGAAACNTVRGAGEDVESAANAVDKAT